MKKVWDADAGSLGNGWNQRRSRPGKRIFWIGGPKIYGGRFGGGGCLCFFQFLCLCFSFSVVRLWWLLLLLLLLLLFHFVGELGVAFFRIWHLITKIWQAWWAKCNCRLQVNGFSMDPIEWWFLIGISFSSGPVSGFEMLVFWECRFRTDVILKSTCIYCNEM